MGDGNSGILMDVGQKEMVIEKSYLIGAFEIFQT